MRIYTYNIFCFLQTIFITSCAHFIVIKDIKKIEETNNSIYIKVTTTENLKNMERSLYAHYVAIIYNNGIVEDLNYFNIYEKLPFMAKRIDLCKTINNGNYESIWIIPKEARSNFNGQNFFYNLEKEDTKEITLIIRGASLSGWHLESDPFIINIKENTFTSVSEYKKNKKIQSSH